MMNPTRLLLASAAALSSATAFTLFLAPPLVRLAALEGPRLYAAALSWLTPPYLYVVLNGIILTIAASSRFPKPGGNDSGDLPEPITPRKHEQDEVPGYSDPGLEGNAENIRIEEMIPLVQKMHVNAEEKRVKEAEADVKIPRWGSGEMPSDAAVNPTASARFSGKRTFKSSTPGNPLGVVRPRRNETLESTWKMITEGRSVPLSRHLKKSDTWETRNAKARELQSTKATVAPMRREPSLGQEELNRRVEAFINKFNEEMRLQREESLRRYWDTVNGRNLN